MRTIDPMKGVRELIGGLVILGASGCTNQFLANYQGARLDPVSHAKSVTERPVDCGLIGTSTFVSAGSFGEPEAVAAASEVGAEFVQWSKGLDANDGPAGAGVVRASLSPTGPVSARAARAVSLQICRAFLSSRSEGFGGRFLAADHCRA